MSRAVPIDGKNIQTVMNKSKPLDPIVTLADRSKVGGQPFIVISSVFIIEKEIANGSRMSRIEDTNTLYL